MSKEWETYNQGGKRRLRRRPVRYHAGTTSTSAGTTTTAAGPVMPMGDQIDADTETAAGLYDDMTKAELIAEADARGLDTSGNKPDILARIEAHDDAA